MLYVLARKGKALTMWNVFVRIEVFIYIHGKVHHVSIAEKIQLPLEKFFLIVDLRKQ